MKIGIVFSGGGHYLEAMKACALIINDPAHEIFYITYKPLKKSDFNKPHYFVRHPEHVFFLKRVILFLINFIQSFKVFLKEKPAVIISTGADVALSSMLIAKIFGRKVIFIESGANVTKPSMTGKLIYKFSDVFIIQWEDLKKYYPKAIIGVNLL